MTGRESGADIGSPRRPPGRRPVRGVPHAVPIRPLPGVQGQGAAPRRGRPPRDADHPGQGRPVADPAEESRVTAPDPALVEAGIRNVREAGANVAAIAREHGWPLSTLDRIVRDGPRPARSESARRIHRWLADRAGDPPPPRACADCGADIRDLHFRSDRCRECAAERRRGLRRVRPRRPRESQPSRDQVLAGGEIVIRRPGGFARWARESGFAGGSAQNAIRRAREGRGRGGPVARALAEVALAEAAPDPDPDPETVDMGIRAVRRSGASLKAIAAEHGWDDTTLRRCMRGGCRGRGRVTREIARWLAARASDPPPDRECADCGRSIADRTARTLRCRECAAERRRARDREHWRRKRPGRARPERPAPPAAAEVRAGAAIFRARRSSVSAWARERGWSPASVWQVLAGRPGSRGAAGEISRALAAIGRGGEAAPPARSGRELPPPAPQAPSRYRTLKRWRKPALLLALEGADTSVSARAREAAPPPRGSAR